VNDRTDVVEEQRDACFGYFTLVNGDLSIIELLVNFTKAKIDMLDL